MEIRERMDKLGIGMAERPSGFSEGYWKKVLSDVRNGRDLSVVMGSLLSLVCDLAEIRRGMEEVVVDSSEGVVEGRGVKEAHVPVVERDNIVVDVPLDVDGVVSEAVEVKLKFHSLGMMDEYPGEMLWWREGTWVYFHFYDGICGCCRWEDVRDLGEYNVRLGDDVHSFSEFTKK